MPNPSKVEEIENSKREKKNEKAHRRNYALKNKQNKRATHAFTFTFQAWLQAHKDGIKIFIKPQ